ncbi:MAG TPA: RtcB family protein [Actinomycetota bacterium]|nr:RtcB family protein [Actinomycetota bacterium]
MNGAEPRRLEEFLWEIPKGYVDGMRVPGRVFASENLFNKALEDRAIEQVANVATLPGIVGAALAMPDIHWGYGFPIGGVAATDVEGDGVISPGGVGFDIGCGVRLIRSDLGFETDVKPRLKEIVRTLGQRTPRGVGQKGAMPLSRSEIVEVLKEGARFPVSRGAGWDEDLELTGDEGVLPNAQPNDVSDRAIDRGAPQLGSLGAGNHFLEVQVVDQIRNEKAAEVMGLFEGQVCVMIHSGSRGLGHQTCTDHVRTIDRLAWELGIDLPDRQLAAAPLQHPKAQSYLGAMDAAGNFARANRQVLADVVRRSFTDVLGRPAREMGMSLVYDVSHNLAKIEEYEVDGRIRPLCVHRKGATRAFGPGHPEIPKRYAEIGQPVVIPGSMGTHSFVLVGSNDAKDRSFFSTCHGAGRAMSRTKAKKMMTGEELKKQLEGKGIVLARSKWKLLSEEAPYAYKDAEEVVDTCEGARLSHVVARLRPVGVIKG